MIMNHDTPLPSYGDSHEFYLEGTNPRSSMDSALLPREEVSQLLRK